MGRVVGIIKYIAILIGNVVDAFANNLYKYADARREDPKDFTSDGSSKQAVAFFTEAGNLELNLNSPEVKERFSEIFTQARSMSSDLKK